MLCASAKPEQLGQVVVVRAVRDGPVPERVGQAAERQRPPGDDDDEGGDGDREAEDGVRHVEPAPAGRASGVNSRRQKPVPGGRVRVPHAGPGVGCSTAGMRTRSTSAKPRATKTVADQDRDAEQRDQQAGAERQAGDDQDERDDRRAGSRPGRTRCRRRAGRSGPRGGGSDGWRSGVGSAVMVVMSSTLGVRGARSHPAAWRLRGRASPTGARSAIHAPCPEASAGRRTNRM